MKFGIVGDPVEHSRSPAMHNAGFAALDLDATFEFVPTARDRFRDVEDRLRTGDLDGVSVTMPHKAHAFAAVDIADAPAAAAHAVNTIVSADEVLTGYNTDIDGVRFSIEKLGLPADTPVLLLGHGGAAAAALVGLAESRPVSISARQSAPAIALARNIGIAMDFVEWGSSLPGSIVVNATPLGMHGEELPRGVVEDCSGLIDMTYGSSETPAIATARIKRLPHADGFDMLVGQAIAAFELFTGVAAPVEVLATAARDH
ncbi:MAG: shikimate dehydrogenase [Acidimicrobiia bacterium]|nr:MAG: shikimate dehydrogenase [Acidimicrobiia bacterium]